METVAINYLNTIAHAFNYNRMALNGTQDQEDKQLFRDISCIYDIAESQTRESQVNLQPVIRTLTETW